MGERSGGRRNWRSPLPGIMQEESGKGYGQIMGIVGSGQSALAETLRFLWRG
jgi:hypothetical protein